MSEKEYKSFEEHTKEELIDLALEEIDWIVIGGQDGEEYYNSIQFIRRVLRSLRAPEELSQGHTRTGPGCPIIHSYTQKPNV